MVKDERFVVETLTELKWNFGSERPLMVIGHSSESVDPFPGYAHDEQLVAEFLKKAIDAFPVGGHPVQCFCLKYETVSRTNGTASYFYVKDGEYAPYIVLSGKRIPPMQSMTRYLAAHEYGHVVDEWICRQMECDKDWPVTKFDKEYAEVRGVFPESAYGGGNWHKNIGEIIANDFRILMCGVEVDFWPHPCPHPLELGDSRLVDYWQKLREQYRFVPDTKNKEEE